MDNELIRVILWCSSCLTVSASTCKHAPYTVGSHKYHRNDSNPFQLESQDYSRGKLNPLQYKQRETASDRCEWEDIEIIAYPPRQRSINDLPRSSWRYCAWGWQSQWVEVDINKWIHFTANCISGPFYSSWVLVYPCIMLFGCQIVICHACSNVTDIFWLVLVYFDSLCAYLQSKVRWLPFSVLVQLL